METVFRRAQGSYVALDDRRLQCRWPGRSAHRSFRGDTQSCSRTFARSAKATTSSATSGSKGRGPDPFFSPLRPKTRGDCGNRLTGFGGRLGVRRLDAAFLWPGLTGHTGHRRVKPHLHKAASNRRTPNVLRRKEQSASRGGNHMRPCRVPCEVFGCVGSWRKLACRMNCQRLCTMKFGRELRNDEPAPAF